MKRLLLRPIALLLLCLSALNGCYSYARVPSETPVDRGRVRLHLSEPRSVALTNTTANDVVFVEGEVVRAGPDSLALSVWNLRARSGYEQRAMGETVVLPRGQMVDVERRRLSPVRSGLLAGAVVLLTTLVSSFMGGGGEDGGGPGGGGAPL